MIPEYSREQINIFIGKWFAAYNNYYARHTFSLFMDIGGFIPVSFY